MVLQEIIPFGSTAQKLFFTSLQYILVQDWSKAPLIDDIYACCRKLKTIFQAFHPVLVHEWTERGHFKHIIQLNEKGALPVETNKDVSPNKHVPILFHACPPFLFDIQLVTQKA